MLAFGGEENLKLQTDVPIPPVGEAEVDCVVTASPGLENSKKNKETFVME